MSRGPGVPAAREAGGEDPRRTPAPPPAAARPAGLCRCPRLLAAAASVACALAPARARAAALEVTWDEDLAPASERAEYQRLLEDIVQKSYAQASAELGLSLGQSLRVKVDTRAHFEEQFGTSAAWTEAAHYSREVIHVNGGSRLDDRFAGYVVHEMTHALFDFQGTAGLLPTWLNEGVAERLRWKRMGLGDLTPNQVSELKQALGKRALVPLPVSGVLSPFGYLQSYAAVLFLEKKGGRASVLRTVRRTLDREPFEPVLEREFGWSVGELEREFSAWVEHLP